ncbi:hypothetical protein HZ993_15515 [Rhodoferax sp. AJA081-3]|uniref:hypothetical protein n=1 Tax=Rhodoferax sp. AJA081-3 TaxID=2752316 RepID=UPI001ADEC856|nr:hypothetical protein [Rhodoferax sp. AJA081-3]QTN26716.1 hypothetical protein HZ993_15515 [Rhodoferax sp. AJA081-3]
MRIANNLLWIDCTAGALVGFVVLLFTAQLSQLQALPHTLLLFMGAANVLYASFSFILATRSKRPMPLIKLLVVANGFWSLVCVCLAVAYANTATLFGLGHLITEAIFVGSLAAQEWKWRALLLQRAT